MDAQQILDMITSNRKFIKLRSNIASQNLAMLHKSFDAVLDEECTLALTLNDSLSAVLFRFSYTSAIDISLSVLARYPDSVYKHLIAEHESLIGRSYVFLTSHDRAEVHLKRAEALAFELPDSDEVKGLRADVLHNLAMNTHHISQGDPRTEDYLKRALDQLEGTNFDSRRGICYLGMGNVKLVEKNYQEALDYNMKALAFFEEEGHYTNLSCACSNIGNCLSWLGRYEESEHYLMRSLDLRSRLGSYSEIAHSYYQVAMLYIQRGDKELAYEQMLISRDYAMISQSVGIQRMILEDLEVLAIELGDRTAAETHRTRLRQIDSIAA